MKRRVKKTLAAEVSQTLRTIPVAVCGIICSYVLPPPMKQKTAFLQTHWSKEKLTKFERRCDYVEASWIYRFVWTRRSALTKAIIADDLCSFLALCRVDNASEKEIHGWLKRACFCGAEEIATYLLKRIQRMTPATGADEYDYLLAYISVSWNTAWTTHYATKIAAAGRPLPNSVYSWSSSETLDKLRGMFPKDETFPQTPFIL